MTKLKNETIPSTPTAQAVDSAPSCFDEYSAREVSWYRTNGKYSSRIIRTYGGTGIEYIICDHDWNRKNPNHQEWIESKMKHQLGNQKA